MGKLLDALKRSKALAKFGCFAAGTLVATAAGLVPIEEIEPGEAVRARNDSTGEVEWRTVTANHVRPDVPTLAIGIEDEREGSWQLTTTAEHPIFVASVGYLPARRLEPGQGLVSESGASSRIVSVGSTGITETVYNLTVEGTENYFVGPSPVLVHNIDFQCANATPVGRVGKGPMHVPHGTNAPDVIGGREYSGHALDRMQGRGLTPSVVEDAITNGTSSPGRFAGTTAHYSAVNNVTVITDSTTGRVVTTYPGTGTGH